MRVKSLAKKKKTRTCLKPGPLNLELSTLAILSASLIKARALIGQLSVIVRY